MNVAGPGAGPGVGILGVGKVVHPGTLGRQPLITCAFESPENVWQSTV